jgi:Fe-S cluster assembly iron-binding protein IscA
MLTITPTATTVLTEARTDKGAPDDFGVRFYATRTDDSDRARLAFKFVASPGEEDTVLDDAGIQAYVAPEVEQLIGDVTIDALQKDGSMGLVVKRAPKQD